MAAAAATAPGAVGSSVAGGFAHPRGDVLPAWMVSAMSACAWTMATMRTVSTDIPSPGIMCQVVLMQPLGPSPLSERKRDAVI